MKIRILLLLWLTLLTSPLLAQVDNEDLLEDQDTTQTDTAMAVLKVAHIDSLAWPKNVQAGIDELLKILGLYEHRHKLPNQLSGGQQQRVSIGRAIVKNPDILLCDEPTGALDYTTSKEILRLIEEVNRKYGNTVIMVTHNEAIKQMADHVIKLRDGKIRHDDLNTNKITASELEW